MINNHPDTRKFNPFRNYTYPPFPGKIPDDSDLFTVLPKGYYPFPVHMMSPEKNFIFQPFLPEVCYRFNEVNGFDEELSKKYKNRVNLIIKQIPILEKLAQELTENPKLSYPYFQKNSEFLFFFNYLRSMYYLEEKFNLNKYVYLTLTLCENIIGSIEYFEDEKLRIYLTPILKHINSQILKLLKARTHPLDNRDYPKVILYSGNSINIWAFLQLFGMSSTSCLEDLYNMKILPDCYLKPFYGSSLIFELYETPEISEVQIGCQ